MPSVDEIKHRLNFREFLRGKYGVEFRHGNARCLCPQNHAHGDATPSMILSKSGDRVKCAAHDCLGGWADAFQIVQLMDQVDFKEASRILGEYVGINGDGAKAIRILRSFRWTDEQGRDAYKLRRDVQRDKDRFLWARDPEGRQCGKGSCQPTLYQLDRVHAAAQVILTEGERDADTVNGLLEALGLSPGTVATCTPNGANDVKEEYLTALHGKVAVFMSGDNDASGRTYREACGQLLAERVGALRVLEVPADRKDWTEWREAGGTPDQLAQVLDTAEPWPRDASPSPFTPIGTLLEEPDDTTDWLVENRLPDGGLSILAGKPKAGKSTLARSLALAVARGTSWLGFPTRESTVVYLALEEKRAEVRRHFRLMGATPTDSIRVFIAPAPSDGLALLRSAVERHHPGLVIIDPLQKLVRIRELNDYAEVSAALEPLLTLARSSGAHLLVVHHLGKGDREGADGIIGSTAIFAAVDTALLLKRSEKYRTLSSDQRYGENLEDMTLTLDPTTKTVLAGPSKAEADQGLMEDAIIEFFRIRGVPAEERLVLDQVEGRRGLKVKALRRLVDCGRVSRTGRGGKADPFQYQLTQNACSVVPPYSREQENKNLSSPVSPHIVKEDSCSLVPLFLPVPNVPAQEAVIELD